MNNKMVSVPKQILRDLIFNAELGLGVGNGRMADYVMRQCGELREYMGETIDFNDSPAEVEEIVMEGTNVYSIFLTK
jgi:hypothetical protein